MRLIYVAGPYTGTTPEQTKLNIASAVKVGQQMILLGWYPVIPHNNTAEFEKLVDQPYEWWIEATKELLRRCDAVVLCPGWERSGGAIGEVKEAIAKGIPVYDTAFDVPCLNGKPRTHEAFEGLKQTVLHKIIGESRR